MTGCSQFTRQKIEKRLDEMILRPGLQSCNNITLHNLFVQCMRSKDAQSTIPGTVELRPAEEEDWYILALAPRPGAPGSPSMTSPPLDEAKKDWTPFKMSSERPSFHGILCKESKNLCESFIVCWIAFQVVRSTLPSLLTPKTTVERK